MTTVGTISHSTSPDTRRAVQYLVQQSPSQMENIMVQAVSYSTFRNNLKSYMRKVNEDADTLLVTNVDPNDNVIVMSVNDYDSLMETVRIIENPYLRDKLTRGLSQVHNGDVTQHELIEPEDS